MRAVPALALAATMVATAALAEAPPPPAFDCSKAYLPVDHVLCSSPELLKANDELSAVWRALRERLNEEQRQQALEAQRQWIKDYPLSCGLPAKGKPAPDKMAAAVPCIDKQVRARTAKLRMQLAELPPVGAAKAIAAPPPSDGRWQGEANPVAADGKSARLSISDKQGAGKQGKAAAYQATFTVRQADGTSWTYHTAAQGGAAAAVFPDDFLAPRQAGRYSYDVQVDLEPALSGAFQLP